MTFKCKINRSDSKKEWMDEGGNVEIENFGPCCAKFSNRAKDETIIRDFLRGYGLNAEDNGTFSNSYMKFVILRRPGAEVYDKTFHVWPLRNGKWAIVSFD